MSDLLADWRKYERSLLTKLANRERELIELHDDYMRLEKLLSDYKRYCRTVWNAQDARRIGNVEAKREAAGER